MITGLEICYKLLSACKPFILKSLKPFEKSIIGRVYTGSLRYMIKWRPSICITCFLRNITGIFCGQNILKSDTLQSERFTFSEYNGKLFVLLNRTTSSLSPSPLDFLLKSFLQLVSFVQRSNAFAWRHSTLEIKRNVFEKSINTTSKAA